MIKTDSLVNIKLYVWPICIAVLVRRVGLRKSMETRLLRTGTALRDAGCRPSGDIIVVWKLRISKIQLYSCVPMNTDYLAESAAWTAVCGNLLSWCYK